MRIAPNSEMPSAGPLMKGKRGLVMGVANNHSIAWGAARMLAAQGAELAFTYQGEAFGKRVQPLAESVGSSLGAAEGLAAIWPLCRQGGG